MKAIDIIVIALLSIFVIISIIYCVRLIHVLFRKKRQRSYIEIMLLLNSCRKISIANEHKNFKQALGIYEYKDGESKFDFSKINFPTSNLTLKKEIKPTESTKKATATWSKQKKLKKAGGLS